jgi:murein DD-endopeptidase MepM/ murein hydrolase activator NlpD
LASRRTTIFIVPEEASSVKHFKFSRGFLLSAASIFALGIVVGSYILYDYCTLKTGRTSTVALEREVMQQRAQIQAFANKIGILKSDIKELREVEKKIRVLANAKRNGDVDGMLGIGGSMPEDLASNLPLTDKHDSLVRQMHDQMDSLCEVTAVEKEAFADLHDYLESRRSLLACKPAIWPTKGWLSSNFGYRTSPFTGRREFHRGIDIATPMGTPIVAPADGKITFVGRKGGFGRMIVIDHGHGIVTRYAHLNKCLVKRGVRVNRGDKIGLVGDSGRTTAPHLHYEVHVDGLVVNPRKYIFN